MPINSPPPCTTWKAADSYAPASSAVPSTNTDTWPDVQRQVFEPHTTGFVTRGSVTCGTGASRYPLL
jgi:hypothetical protein